MDRQVIENIIAERHTNLLARFRAVARAFPEKLAVMRLDRGEDEAESLTFAGLDRQARSLAALFQKKAAQGERALLLFDNDVECVYAFLGCVYGRVIAAPLPAPMSFKVERYLNRTRNVIADGGIRYVLTTSRMADRLRDAASKMEGYENLEWIVVDQIEDRSAQWREQPIHESDLAYLQYTSGSTASAKGVMVTHRNLTSLIDYNGTVLGHRTHGTQAVCWMPYFHDFGLIEGMLTPLAHGMPVYLMSPFDFVQNPLRWIDAVHRYRASHSSGPSFSFDLCARKSTPEQRSRLDLSCWYRASCAAEPIRSSSMKQFISTYESCGFSPSALVPAWGLAEATLLVTLSESGVQYYEVDGQALESHRVRPRAGNGRVTTLVGCGHVVPGPWDIEVQIVNPQTKQLTPPGEVGEIWVSGDLVAKGYWQRPVETEATFHAQIEGISGKRYMRSGDLGFMDGREFVFTGRRKDLIIVEGRNHYPQEIEKTAERSHPALRPGCSIVFSFEMEGPVRIVIVCELNRGYHLLDETADGATGGIAVARKELEAAMRREVAEEHQIRLHDIVFVPTYAIPKTTSGKVERSGCKARYLDGTLPVYKPEASATPAVEASA